MIRQNEYQDSGDMEWFGPILNGDRFTFKLYSPTDIVMKSSKLAGKAFIQYEKTEYYNQRGELVAISRNRCVKAEAEAASKVKSDA